MSPINTSHLRHFMGKRNSRTDNALYDGIHFCGSPLSRSLYGRFQCNQLELHHAIISLSEMISSELCKWPWKFFFKKRKMTYILFELKDDQRRKCGCRPVDMGASFFREANTFFWGSSLQNINKNIRVFQVNWIPNAQWMNESMNEETRRGTKAKC